MNTFSQLLISSKRSCAQFSPNFYFISLEQAKSQIHESAETIHWCQTGRREVFMSSHPQKASPQLYTVPSVINSPAYFMLNFSPQPDLSDSSSSSWINYTPTTATWFPVQMQFSAPSHKPIFVIFNDLHDLFFSTHSWLYDTITITSEHKCCEQLTVLQTSANSRWARLQWNKLQINTFETASDQ